ncbi:putative F-box protein At1g12855 [Apium graveolens]|uniref:putative F-box protein At1g12855 n=1 Tax=Apium graveolens TaxID=4045 RepID=UPI003D78E0A2
MAKKSSGFYFPEEVIFQILSWLPVISLLRFKLVCKSWRSMISKSELIENHTANSLKREAFVLSLPTIPVDEVSYSSGRRGDIKNAFYFDTHDLSYMLHFPPQISDVKHLIRSCNGLVCLSNILGNFIYLLNPLTRGFKILPTPKIDAFYRIDLGFCFDSISNDYKLLRIMQSDVSNYGRFTFVLKAELYSANANSWKKIKVPKAVTKILPWPYSKCVDFNSGVVYFENGKELLSFDSHNEVFGIYQFPESVRHKRKSDVLDFNGSVAMIFESVCDESVLSLWTLDDVCGNVSWVKKFNLEVVPGISWINLHLGAGQYVAQCNNGASYVFYDYRKKETTELPHLQNCVSVMKYRDSFVSLEGFEQLQ